MDTDDLIQDIAEQWLAAGCDSIWWRCKQGEIAERISELEQAAEEERIIRDSERVAELESFIMGRDWLDEAEHHYARRKGEREEELITPPHRNP